MTQELYKRHRPTKFTQMVGNVATVKSLARMARDNKIPHTLLFSGPSGCGKTTLARIVVNKLGCNLDHDFREINCADFRGIDMVRDIRDAKGIAPFGESRVWLIDEAHQLSNAAQNAFLKLLEDTPDHVYFMLATTDPGKLIPTIRNRATEIKMALLSVAESEKLVNRTCEAEEASISSEVMEKLIDVAERSPRKLLVLLEQVLSIEGEDQRLDMLEKVDAKRQAIELARALINPRSNWATVSSLIEKIEEEPETIRWMVLSYASKVMLNKNSKITDRAFHIVQCFSENFYNTKRAGLIAACYDVVSATSR